MNTIPTDAASRPYNYTWDNGFTPDANKTAYPTMITTYIVTCADSIGCEDSDSIPIHLLKQLPLTSKI